jgi:hypothetical protein
MSMVSAIVANHAMIAKTKRVRSHCKSFFQEIV